MSFCPAGKGINGAAVSRLRRVAQIDRHSVVIHFLGFIIAVDDPSDLNSLTAELMALGVPQIVDGAVVIGLTHMGAVVILIIEELACITDGLDVGAIAIEQPSGVNLNKVVDIAVAIQTEGEFFNTAAVLEATPCRRGRPRLQFPCR